MGDGRWAGDVGRWDDGGVPDGICRYARLMQLEQSSMGFALDDARSRPALPSGVLAVGSLDEVVLGVWQNSAVGCDGGDEMR